MQFKELNDIEWLLITKIYRLKNISSKASNNLNKLFR